jgi:uncharacterized protein YdaU (DUF1376 family)
MPLYVGDYLADTAHLRTVEHGAYLLLIMHYWRQQGLPTDDLALARIARLTLAEWKRARPAIEPLFLNDWKHKRIEFELTEAARISQAGRKGGLASAAKRATTVERPLNDHTNDPSTTGQALQPQPQLQEEERSSLRSEARKRATRLASDWVPSTEDFEFAHGKGLQHSRIRTEAEKFRNYWTAKSGKDATKIDWPATWRNWILNCVEREGKPNAAGKRTIQQASADLLERVRAFDEPPPDSIRDGTGEADVRMLPAR